METVRFKREIANSVISSSGINVLAIIRFSTPKQKTPEAEEFQRKLISDSTLGKFSDSIIFCTVIGTVYGEENYELTYEKIISNITDDISDIIFAKPCRMARCDEMFGKLKRFCQRRLINISIATSDRFGEMTQIFDEPSFSINTDYETKLRAEIDAAYNESKLKAERMRTLIKNGRFVRKRFDKDDRYKSVHLIIEELLKKPNDCNIESLKILFMSCEYETNNLKVFNTDFVLFKNLFPFQPGEIIYLLKYFGIKIPKNQPSAVHFSRVIKEKEIKYLVSPRSMKEIKPYGLKFTEEKIIEDVLEYNLFLGEEKVYSPADEREELLMIKQNVSKKISDLDFQCGYDSSDLEICKQFIDKMKL